MVKLEKGHFRDDQGRVIVLRGVNFTADVKVPAPGTNRYINTPCKLEDCDIHFQRIRAIGFNCIRFLFTWDALQPDSPNEFDEEYIDFAIKLVRKAIHDYGLFVFMDPHQDIWSRFSGGSGAPLWTLHAAGLDHRYFQETHAAMIWDPDAKGSIKMQWSSNYHRLVCQTMFTLFFAGPEFAPNAMINGKNVGTYLKDKYFAALAHFMKRVDEANLGPRLLGWESLNEPGHGLIGYDHLDGFPESKTHVKLGTAPTPFQAMLLGKGIPQKVETYKFTSFGMRRVEHSHFVRPKRGTWLIPEDLQKIDAKHGWKRSWPGGCIWEFHGVYDAEAQMLLKPYYFQSVGKYKKDSQYEDGSSDDNPGVTSKSSNRYKKLPSSPKARKVKTNNSFASEFSTATNTGQSISMAKIAEAADEDAQRMADPDVKFEYDQSSMELQLFVDKFFVKHWMEFSDLVKKINPDWFQFMQAPVNIAPPNMEKLYPGVIDPSRVVYTPHFYDGMTLMLKRWRWLNVDAIGVMRDIYSSPLKAVRFGDARICQSFAEQFMFLKQEGKDRLGKDVAFLMSEIGIPYDMDKKNAYISGYWDNQIRAMDANLSALETAKANYTIWCYSVNNTHKHGDGFAGEDLSIYSRDDEKKELEGKPENGVRAAQSVIRPTPRYVSGTAQAMKFNFRQACYKLTMTPTIRAPTEIFVPAFHFPKLQNLDTIHVTEGTVSLRDHNVVIWDHGDTIGIEQTLTIYGEPTFKDSLYSYFEGIHRMCKHIVGSLNCWGSRY